MKNDKRKENRKFHVDRFVAQEGKCYGLLCLQFERAIRYAMYIEDGEEFALELLGNQRKEAEKIFDLAVRGGLSPLHLREVAMDQAVEEEWMEIFC